MQRDAYFCLKLHVPIIGTVVSNHHRIEVSYREIRYSLSSIASSLCMFINKILQYQCCASIRDSQLNETLAKLTAWIGVRLQYVRLCCTRVCKNNCFLRYELIVVCIICNASFHINYILRWAKRPMIYRPYASFSKCT